MDKSHNKKYIITMHAKERFKERVSPNGNNNIPSIVKWLKRALNDAQSIDSNDGNEWFKYKQYLIVMNGRTLITISYHKHKDIKPLKNDLAAIIARRLKKEVRPLITSRKELNIKLHELQIQKWKSTSYAKQVKLEQEVKDLQSEISNLKKQVGSIVGFAQNYGINKHDFIKDSDLV